MKPSPDSRNTSWRNEQFRAYADHMATDEFRIAVDALLESPKPAAYMCAEAVPWRCHRNLLSEDLEALPRSDTGCTMAVTWHEGNPR